jgi:drug/metabolite transporter (DMT)-like permease
MLVGVAAGVGAGALWAFVFVAPGLVAPYTPFDLAMLRYLIFGVVSVAVVLARFRGLPRLPARVWRSAIALGFFGYASYFLALAYAVGLAGTSVVALIIGTMPIVLAVIGNLKDRSAPWSLLAAPLLLMAVGLVVLKVGAFGALSDAEGASFAALAAGILLSLVALGVWVFYAMLNADSARLAPGIGALEWTSLQGLGTLACVVLIAPLGVVAGFSAIPTYGLLGAGAGALWAWALITALLSSFAGTLLWVMAARRLPLALSGQLIVFESVFALLFGFVVERRPPHAYEAAAAALLIVAVVWGVRVFHGARMAQATGARADAPL